MTDTQPAQRLLLLAGIPGTGKTEMGAYLQEHHNFIHMDAEAFAGSAPRGTTWGDFVQQVDERKHAGSDIVITWGFMPGTDDPVIRALQSLGFRLFWFDADRNTARQIFSRRGTVPLEAFDIQMARIDQMNIAAFHPTVVKPLDERGEFRAREDIASDILN